MAALFRCACHVWVCGGMSRVGPCGRCGQVPRYEGRATPEAKTVCLHSGPCKP